MRKLLFSHRFRFMLLILFAALPAIGLAIYDATNDGAAARQTAEYQLRQETRFASITHRLLIAETQQILSSLARKPELNDANQMECGGLFTQLYGIKAAFANLGLADANGRIVCSALSFTGPVSAADRAWFQRAVQTGEFAVGEYQIGRITQIPVLVFAQPILNDGRLLGVVFAALDLKWFEQWAQSANLPEGAVYMVVDRRGTILARWPKNENWVGRTESADSVITHVLEAPEPDIIEARGVDGVMRLYAHAPLPIDIDYEPDAHVMVGLSPDQIYAQANRTLRLQLSILGVVTILALIAAWAGHEIFVMRRMNALLAATRELAEGDLSARSGVPHDLSEMGRLARAFDSMAETLEQQSTERERAIAALSKSEERYRLLFETSPEGIAIHRNGRVVALNAAAARMVGVENPSDLVGRPIGEFVHPDDRDQIFERIQKMAETGQPAPMARERFLRVNGDILPVEVTASPIQLDDGMAFQVIFRDISEQLKQEERLRLQSATLNAVASAIAITDPEGVIEWVNPAFTELTGYSREEAIGQRMSILKSGKHNRAFYRTMWETILSGQTWRGELINRRKDGSLYIQHQSITSLRDANGKISHFISSMLDITARKEGEAQIARQLQTLKALSHLSAQLRSILTEDEAVPILLAGARAVVEAEASLIVLMDPERGECIVSQAQGFLLPLTGLRVQMDEAVAQEMSNMQRPCASDDFLSTEPGRQYASEIENMGPAAFVPLLSEESVLGVLMVARESGAAPFDESEMRVLTTVGEMGGNVLRRIHLYADALRRLRRVQALRAIDVAITGSRERDEVLNSLLEEVTTQLNVDAASVLLFDPETQELAFAAGRGFHTHLVETTRLQLGEGYAGKVALERKPLGEGDLLRTESFKRFQLAVAEGFEAYYAAPLVAHDRLLGVLETFHRSQRGFGKEWLEFLEALAGQTALALENASLYEELRAHAAELERRVAERTAELEAAYEQLRLAHEEVSRALAQEQELSELKSRFLSIASHEFRTPLTTIFSSAELLEHYGQRWDEHKRLMHLRRIQSTVQRMTALIDDVLLVSRADAGKLRFEPKRLNLVAFCQEIMEELRIGMGAHHRLTLDLDALDDPTKLTVRLDERLLRHICHNLLSNAIKYSSKGSEVTLALECKDDRVMLRVSDHGIGIPAWDQEHLFEPFHRASNVGAISGSGLGLNIVQRAVQRHGGGIDIHSKEGQGTTVVVTLPVECSADAMAEE
ncbi:MAG: PAS domain S-box protein [Chloroflexi bacterium]|nr:PAS domain S-box protein [Chloroflexota bacterium]